MDNLKKVVGVILAAIALAVAFHALVGEFYGSLLPRPGMVWDILNYFMAGGVLVAVVHHFRAKRALDRRETDGGVNSEYLMTNLLFFAAVILSIWFFRNWFDNMVVDGRQGDTVRFIWQIVNPLFVVVMGTTACQLWCGARAKSEAEAEPEREPAVESAVEPEGDPESDPVTDPETDPEGDTANES